VIAKPTPADLGIDPGAQHWQRSGAGRGAIEIAFAQAGPEADPQPGQQPSPQPGQPNPQPSPQQWVLMRVTDDPDGRVLVFDVFEWECFLDGARKGEFDDAATFPGR
jgi:hypothetical protein